MDREEELRDLAERLRARCDSKAFLVAHYAADARRTGLSLVDSNTLNRALDEFEAAHQHATFAQDQVALEVYGCFWHRVTAAMICGPTQTAVLP